MTTRPPSDLGHFRPHSPQHYAQQHPYQQEDGPSPRIVDPRRRRRRGQRPTHGRRRKRSLLKAIAFAALGLVASVAAGIAVFVFVFSPSDLVRGEIVRQVKAYTGRDLVIAGGASFTIYPNIGVSLSKISLSPPPGMIGRPTIEADRLHLSMAFLPLLSSKVIVKRIFLMRPIIDLRVDRSGRQSWDMAGKASGGRAWRKIRFAHLGNTATLNDAGSRLLPDSQIKLTSKIPGGRPGGPSVSARGSLLDYLDGLDGLELRSIRMRDGIVQYSDERSGQAEVVTGLNVTFTGRRIADPLKAVGGLTWNGERVGFDAQLKTLRELIRNTPTKASVRIKSAPVNATFEGTVTLGETPHINGDTNLTGHSFAALMRWVGAELPNGKPLGHLLVQGQLKASAAEISLGGARLELGKTSAKGAVKVQLQRARPLVTADLRMAELDIDKLSAHFTGARSITRARGPSLPRSQKQVAQPVERPAVERPASGPGTSPARGVAPRATNEPKLRPTYDPLRARQRQRPSERNTPPHSIEELLRRNPAKPGNVGRFSPQVRGYTARSGWSDVLIDASGLGLVDTSSRLAIDGFKVAGLKIGRTILRVNVTNSSARVDLDDIVLYGGRGRGVVTVRPAQRKLLVGINISASGVSALPLLKDAADFDKIDGTGQFSAALSGSGRSQKQIISSLNGNARFTFADGAVVGWNIAQIIRGLRKGQISGFNAVPSQKTDFSELSGLFVVAKGVARNKDLKMTSPLLRLTGAGSIGIGGRTINMLMRPKLVSSLDGQGSTNGLSGLEIPLRITGSWERPNITPELGRVFQNPNQVADTVKSLKQRFKGKKASEIFRDVLGDKRKGGGSAKSLIEGLFRQ